jgi:hypothetical protein
VKDLPKWSAGTKSAGGKNNLRKIQMDELANAQNPVELFYKGIGIGNGNGIPFFFAQPNH